MIAVDTSARRIAQTYRQQGNGLRLAGFNFGNCIASERAKEHTCLLLYVGSDFAGAEIVATL